MIKDIKETLWEINCDGYYPYCPKCKYEPGNGNLTHFCPNCGADLRGDKSKNRIPLSKAEFCKVLDSLRRNKEFLDELNNVLSKIDEDNFIYSTGLEEVIVGLLEILFEDKEDQWISYWVWEEDYGKTYEKGDVVESDGTIIPLETAEELYDFLVKNMKEKENVQ